ncbi:MAG: amino acid deaminase [Streptosporangiales bacterium]|nr:amino acid deaminase [Streptosporangiales bacterium]MBO0891496.1 amino acid deaminase [Acidothermales bacterium]
MSAYPNPPVRSLGYDYRIAPVGGDVLGGDVARGDLVLPVVVLEESALAHNVRVMADYCRDVGVSIAPHGKTHMSPQLAHRQLDAGAWAITVANVAQARVYHAFGVERLLIANQVVDEQALRLLSELLRADPGLEVFCLVDSTAGVQLMDRVLGAADVPRPVAVLVELGLAGGRSGCRSTPEAVAVADAVRDAGTLRLAGVEGYEGVVHGGPTPGNVATVDAFLRELRALAETLDGGGRFADRAEIVVTAGGSAYFDRVAEQLAPFPGLSKPVRTVIRSGSYLTHDHGSYELVSPFGTRLADRPRLRPAGVLWARVSSVPEPGLAIAGFGKRDAPYDLGLPVPLAVAGDDGDARPLTGASVARLNDQHAFVQLPPDSGVRVGDVMTFGMSHPCTVFDKWRLLPVVDDDGRVVQLIQTYF